MKKVVIKKLEKPEIEVIQEQLQIFASILSQKFKNASIYDFLDCIIAVDISTQLYYILRNKIEKDNVFQNLTLTLSQASIISKASNFNELDSFKTDYSKNVMLKISNNIDQQLKSLL
ncbi:MAG: hypothetical protein ACK4IZ_03315 [Flavobacterium sp.]|uniref:hypothetical protein n=1 Tax=Flavobacterium sp. TaxID=239 RepID=UPI00391D0063